MMGLNSDIVYSIVDFPYDSFDISSITTSQRDALGVILGCWDMGDSSYRMTSRLVHDLSLLRAGDIHELLDKTPTSLEQYMIDLYWLEIDQIYCHYHKKLPSYYMICGERPHDGLKELSLAYNDLTLDSGLLLISSKIDQCITDFFVLREEVIVGIPSLCDDQSRESDSFVDFVSRQLDRISLSNKCEAFLLTVKNIQSDCITGYNQYSVVLSLLYDIVSLYLIGLTDPEMFVPHGEEVSLDGYWDGDDDWDDEE